MKITTTFQRGEKLVCEHGDFFVQVDGTPMAYSPQGVGCSGVMYRRSIHEGKEKCPECKTAPGRGHFLFCSKESCPHCSKSLLTCLAKKHGIRSMRDFQKKHAPETI